jgi:hypothetical protein
MSKTSKRKYGWLAVTPLALALITTSHPKHWVVVCLCSAICLSLTIAGWAWASKKGVLPITRWVRPFFLIVSAISLSTFIAWYFWIPDIAVSPPRIVFGAVKEEFLGDTNTFAVTNNTDEDKYVVGTLLLIHSPEWATNDFSIEVPSTGVQGDNDISIAEFIENGTRLPLFLVTWNRLRARESRDITLKHIKRLGSVTLTACITSWHDEEDIPHKISSPNGMTFTPSETPPWPNGCMLNEERK